MEPERKYFLEKKGVQSWITILGDLTNDPNDKSILSFKHKFDAEDWLKPMAVRWYSDFSGKSMRQDEGHNFSIRIQDSIKEKLALKNIDLYNDFLVTEHEFINNDNK